MNRRRFVALAPLAGLALLPLRNSTAGGWASVRIVDGPDLLEAGKPMTLALVIEQHGITPVDIAPLVIMATNDGTGESFESTARKAEGTGNYTVELTFPSDGIWNLTGAAGGFPPFDMGSLNVGQAVGGTTILAPGGAVVIDMTGGMGSGVFAPGRVEITPGTLVVWTNNSTEGHTVVIDGDPSGSGLIGPGAAYALRFDEPGTFTYVCGPHPGMSGTIVVV